MYFTTAHEKHELASKEVKTMAQKSSQNFRNILFFIVYTYKRVSDRSLAPLHHFFNNWCARFNLDFPLYLL